MLHRFATGLFRHLRQEDGGITAEFVVLFPALLVLAGFLMDVAYVFYVKSQVYATVQDVNRIRAVGKYTSDDEVVAALQTRISQRYSDEAVVSAVTDNGILTSRVTIPMHDMQILGFFGSIAGDAPITVGDRQFVEAWDVASAEPEPEKDPLLIDGTYDPSTLPSLGDVVGTVGEVLN